MTYLKIGQVFAVGFINHLHLGVYMILDEQTTNVLFNWRIIKAVKQGVRAFPFKCRDSSAKKSRVLYAPSTFE